MKRWLKTFLILVAIFLIPTLWLLISHILAKHALERYKAQLRAAGETLTIDELLPPRVPSEQNGAKLFLQGTPYIPNKGVLYSNGPVAMRTVPPNKAIIGWQQPDIVSEYNGSLVTNTWDDVEQDLKQQASDLDFLHQAARSSGLDFGVDYRQISLVLPFLAKLKGAALLLSYATVFDLSRGQTASAVTNVHTSLTLVDKWDDRLLISQLVRIAMAAIASTEQWEVLQSTNLTDSELAMLQRDWESMEFARSMENALKMERATGLEGIDELRTSNSPSAILSVGRPVTPGGGSSSGALDFIQDLGQSASRKTADTLWRISWSYDDQLRRLQEYQVAIETVRQIETNGFFDNALTEQDRKMKGLGLNNRTNDWLRVHLADGILNGLDTAPGSTVKILNRVLRIESTRRCTIIAIALKRYQRRHGTLPADLKALAPEFLSEIPRDPMDDQPLHYQPNPDGTFTLYSMTWIWPQPATAQEVQEYYTNLQRRMPK